MPDKAFFFAIMLGLTLLLLFIIFAAESNL
jgi:hypothetical protein